MTNLTSEKVSNQIQVDNKKQIIKGPVNKIPSILINEYSLDGKIPIQYLYRDNSVSMKTIWSEAYLESYCNRFTPSNIFKNKHGKEPYPGASRLLCLSLNKFEVKNKHVAVIGSQTPWIEAILINLNCNTITTVEYNVPLYSGKRIKTISYKDFYRSQYKFDAIITFSSIEHSGLGRYGESLEPFVDIEAMNVIYDKLISTGFLFLGVPIGKDVLVWNVHRIYGKIRMPILIEKFHLLDCFGGKLSYLNNSSVKANGLQPVFVLQKL